MLKFHERLKCNPFKRARFGLKLYRLCESTGDMCGYTWNFKVHSGQDCDENLPASTKVVLDLCKDLLGRGYYVYLDNWYSSPQLFHTLLLNKTHAVGTVRLTRKHMPNNFLGTKIKKGDHVFKTANGVMALLWKDRKDVKMLSTWHTSEIIWTGKTNASGIFITKPACVISYNKGMEGVDRSDQISATCRSVRKHVKWYKKLFFYMIDISLVNTYLIYKKLHQDQKRLTFSMFKIMLARVLLQSAEILDFAKAGRKRLYPTPDHLRAKNGHFLELNPTKSGSHYKRCAVSLKNGQRKETKYQCDRCKISLCPSPCFKDYHLRTKF